MKKREAAPKPHPMGEPVPGRWFAFFTEEQIITTHAMLVEADTPEEAENIARDRYANGERSIAVIQSIALDVNIKPRRVQHELNHDRSVPEELL